MSDFLSWDTDLDLDLLLGEYTEYDPSDNGSDDYDCSTAKKKKTNTSATQPSTLAQYKFQFVPRHLKQYQVCGVTHKSSIVKIYVPVIIVYPVPQMLKP